MDPTTSIKGNATKRPTTAQRGSGKEGQNKVRGGSGGRRMHAKLGAAKRVLAALFRASVFASVLASVLSSVLSSVIFMRVFYLSLARSYPPPFGANIFII